MRDASLHLAEIGRFFLIITLAAAVVGKSTAMKYFIASTEGLLRLPHTLARPVAMAIVMAEGSIVLLLAAGGTWSQIGAAASLFLFVAFSSAILMALIAGRAVRCNCFGGRGHRISSLDLVRNAVLIAAAAAILTLGPAGEAPAVAVLAVYLGLGLNLFLVTGHLREIRSALRIDV